MLIKKRIGPLLVLIFILASLMACDGTLEKPTELEEKQEVAPQTDRKTETAEVGDYTIVHSIAISEDEILLPPTEQVIEEGNTALDALIAVTKAHGIQLDYRGGKGTGVYVDGISNVYEFDRGKMSGWQYRINGVFPDRGVEHVTLCDGDRVEWLYTTDPEDFKVTSEPFRENGKCPKNNKVK